MTVSSHLEELRRKHESLSAEVDDAHRHASMDSLELAAMKKQKLKIKEEIERLQTQ